jgi:hypothetical protein
MSATALLVLHILIRSPPELDHPPRTFPPPLDSATSYAMRRAINGPITERIEPPEDIITRPLDDLEGTKETYTRDNRPYLTEYLYAHYQGEKYSSKFFRLPSPAVFDSRKLG